MKYQSYNLGVTADGRGALLFEFRIGVLQYTDGQQKFMLIISNVKCFHT